MDQKKKKKKDRPGHPLERTCCANREREREREASPRKGPPAWLVLIQQPSVHRCATGVPQRRLLFSSRSKNHPPRFRSFLLLLLLLQPRLLRSRQRNGETLLRTRFLAGACNNANQMESKSEMNKIKCKVLLCVLRYIVSSPSSMDLFCFRKS